MKVIFTSVLIAFGSSTNPLVEPAPSVAKETMIINDTRADDICAELEKDLHYGLVVTNPETGRKVSILVETNQATKLTTRVERQTKCTRVR